MASFVITANGSTSGQVLSSAPSAVLVGGVFAGATVSVEASKDGTTYAPVLIPTSAPGVTPVAIPSGWYVRTTTLGATASTNIVVEVA